MSPNPEQPNQSPGVNPKQPGGDDRSKSGLRSGYGEQSPRPTSNDPLQKPGSSQSPQTEPGKKLPGERIHFGDQEPDDPRHIETIDSPAKGGASDEKTT